MRAARREGQKDALLCPAGCKRNLLSGYAVSEVLIVRPGITLSTAPFDIARFTRQGIAKNSLSVDASFAAGVIENALRELLLPRRALSVSGRLRENERIEPHDLAFR